MKRLTYTVSDVADLLGISRGTAYQAARTGQIPTIRIGKRLLVPIAALQKILADAAPDTGLVEKIGGAMVGKE